MDRYYVELSSPIRSDDGVCEKNNEPAKNRVSMQV